MQTTNLSQSQLTTTFCLGMLACFFGAVLVMANTLCGLIGRTDNTLNTVASLFLANGLGLLLFPLLAGYIGKFLSLVFATVRHFTTRDWVRFAGQVVLWSLLIPIAIILLFVFGPWGDLGAGSLLDRKRKP